jgi:hypothetical protein
MARSSDYKDYLNYACILINFLQKKTNLNFAKIDDGTERPRGNQRMKEGKRRPISTARADCQSTTQISCENEAKSL